MAEEAKESVTETFRSGSTRVIDLMGRLAGAMAEATGEVTVGTLRATGDFAANLAEGVANTVNTAVTDSADVAKRGADRFFDRLEKDDGDEGGKPARKSTAKSA
jgi:hypothetical protein